MSQLQAYLAEVRARQALSYNANPDVPRLVAMLERAIEVLEEWKDSGEHDFKDALSDIEQIARGEK